MNAWVWAKDVFEYCYLYLTIGAISAKDLDHTKFNQL